MQKLLAGLAVLVTVGLTGGFGAGSATADDDGGEMRSRGGCLPWTSPDPTAQTDFDAADGYHAKERGRRKRRGLIATWRAHPTAEKDRGSTGECVWREQ